MNEPQDESKETEQFTLLTMDRLESVLSSITQENQVSLNPNHIGIFLLESSVVMVRIQALLTNFCIA